MPRRRLEGGQAQGRGGRDSDAEFEYAGRSGSLDQIVFAPFVILCSGPSTTSPWSRISALRGTSCWNPRDQARVDTTNILYDFTTKMVDIVSRRRRLGAWRTRGTLSFGGTRTTALCLRLLGHVSNTAATEVSHRNRRDGHTHHPTCSRRCVRDAPAKVAATIMQMVRNIRQPVLDKPGDGVPCRVVVTELMLTRQASVVRARGTALVERRRPEREAASRQTRGGTSRQLLPECTRVLTISGTFAPSGPLALPLFHLWSPPRTCSRLEVCLHTAKDLSRLTCTLVGPLVIAGAGCLSGS